MNIRLFQIDAFTDRRFAGNPAAVCPLEEWLDDTVLQAIAAENNLSETAFFVPAGDRFALRWFTPAQEVDLCGHATLASAFVVLRYLQPGRDEVTFSSHSGLLTVSRDGDRLRMDFPAWEAKECAAPAALLTGLGQPPVKVLRTRDYLAIYAAESDVGELLPDMQQLITVDASVIVTAPGNSVDFVSRFFAPKAGIPEDPVTGSAHCTLVPYWSRRLGKTALHARQLSHRGGELFCEQRGDRVWIAGHAVTYLEGTIEI